MAGLKRGVRPPSTRRVVPVTEPARGLARKAMTDATSCGVANRPSGISPSISATMSSGGPSPRAEYCAATPAGPSHNGLLTGPGATPVSAVLAPVLAAAAPNCTGRLPSRQGSAGELGVAEPSDPQNNISR